MRMLIALIGKDGADYWFSAVIFFLSLKLSKERKRVGFCDMRNQFFSIDQRRFLRTGFIALVLAICASVQAAEAETSITKEVRKELPLSGDVFEVEGHTAFLIA